MDLRARRFINYSKVNLLRNGIAQAVLWLATGWTVRGSDPGVCETGPGNHQASYVTVSRSFPAEKRLGCGVNHSTICKADVQEIVEL